MKKAEELTLEELAYYASYFERNFTLERLYNEFKDIGKDPKIEKIAIKNKDYLDFIRVVHKYYTVTGKGGLLEAKLTVDKFLEQHD